MHSCQKNFRKNAFSLMEVLVVVGILGVVAAVVFSGSRGISDGARVTELESDVATINQAAKVYLANGGSFDEFSTSAISSTAESKSITVSESPVAMMMADFTQSEELIATSPADATQALLNKLKTRRTAADAAAFAGFGGSMLDKRIAARIQSSTEAASGEPRAIWNSAKQRFGIVTSGNVGVKEFYFDASLAEIDFGEESRENSGIDLNTNDGWIWAYEDTPSIPPPGPTLIPVTGGGTTGGSSGDGGSDSGGGPQQLLAPTISPGGGAFQYTEFPLTVLISNPNSGLSSSLMVSTGGAFTQYTGPISVTPDMVVSAYATSASSFWTDSPTVTETYTRESYQLQPPIIVASPSSQFDSSTQEITVTLSSPNPAGLSKIVYWLSTSLTPVDYSAPFTLNAADYPDGLVVFGQEVSLDTFVVDSAATQNGIINAEPVKLNPPTIALSATAFDEETSIITATLTNSNSSGSSQIYYALKDPAGGYPAVSSYLPYVVPIPVSVDNYPDGFHIQAYAKSLDTAAYEDSDFTEAVSTAEFFDIGLTGDVLFILDASGSMNASHGNSKRFPVVIQETINAINGLSETQKFSVVLFSHYIRWTDGSGILKPATAANKAAMIAGISAQTAVGGTNYGMALGEALNFDVYPEQVLFLSDGLPNQNNYLDETATLASLGIVVDTIGIGQINSQAPLQNIASLTSGSYTFIGAPGSGGKLTSPVFSVAGGSFDYSAFPLALSITNPNAIADPSSSIKVSVNGGAVTTYSGPLSLAQNTTVSAYVSSTNSAWSQSSNETQYYQVRNYVLAKPVMTLSATEFDTFVSAITVTLTDPNPVGLSSMVYWLEGQDEATQAVPYTGPFAIGATVSDGQKVATVPVARAVSAQSFVIDSAPTSEVATVAIDGTELTKNALAALSGEEIVNATPLDPVKFDPEGNAFDHTLFPLTVTLYNPNSVISGSYMMVSINGAAYTPYINPLSLGYNTKIVAYVETGNTVYSRSPTRGMGYEVKKVELDKPNISLSDDAFDSSTKTITMTISNPNSAAISNVIYWFDGQDEATQAVVYTGPVTLTADEWEVYSPDGGDEIDIFARAVGTETFVKDSSTDDEDIDNDL